MITYAHVTCPRIRYQREKCYVRVTQEISCKLIELIKYKKEIETELEIEIEIEQSSHYIMC